MKGLLADTAVRAAKYLGELDHRSVVPSILVRGSQGHCGRRGGPLPGPQVRVSRILPRGPILTRGDARLF